MACFLHPVWGSPGGHLNIMELSCSYFAINLCCPNGSPWIHASHFAGVDTKEWRGRGKRGRKGDQILMHAGNPRTTSSFPHLSAPSPCRNSSIPPFLVSFQPLPPSSSHNGLLASGCPLWQCAGALRNGHQPCSICNVVKAHKLWHMPLWCCKA